jgi:hypothetical protein
MFETRDREIPAARTDSTDVSPTSVERVRRNGATGNQSALRRLSRNSGDSAERMAVPPSVHEEIRSAGQPLDSTIRTFTEPRFGRDFSNVRAHIGDNAAETATAINARAYTYGQDIVFNDGEYSPGSSEGRKTLAHELAHTVQQTGGQSNLSNLSETTAPNDDSEAEAVAESVMNDADVGMETSSGKQVARQPPDAGPGAPPPPPPAAPAKKNVTVNITILKGGTHSVADTIKYANNKVFNQADVEVVKGKEETLDEAKSKAILGNDLVLEEYTDVTKPTTEEKALFKVNQVAGEISVFFRQGAEPGHYG